MILVDLNVLLDAIQKRMPHYTASAALLDGVVQEHVRAVLPGHVFTTLHFIIGAPGQRCGKPDGGLAAR